MVISAVFEPRGRAYHVPREQADAQAHPETESQRARVPTVFAYGTPRTCEVYFQIFEYLVVSLSGKVDGAYRYCGRTVKHSSRCQQIVSCYVY
jgi:hypothetical protein